MPTGLRDAGVDAGDRSIQKVTIVSVGEHRSESPETAPMPIIGGPRRWQDTLESLSHSEYRRYALGLLCSSAGLWIARIATDWLVLEMTGSVALLGIVIAVQLVPPVILGALGGVVSDWMSARAAVVSTQLLFAALYIVLGCIVLNGDVAPFWVFAISAGVGIVSCLDGPSRAVLTSQTVTVRAFPNAISINAVIPQIGGIVGAMLAGVAIMAFDIGLTMIVAAIGLTVGAIATFLIRSSRLVPRPPGPRAVQRGQIREAIRYVRRKPEILMSIVMLGVLSLSGLSASVLLAWMADTKYETGATGYSLYTTAASVGALVGGLLSTSRRRFTVRGNALALAVSAIPWLLCGLTTWPAVFLVAIAAASLARLLFLIGNDTLTQLSTNLGIRGRVVSLYLMVATAGQVIASVILGWIVTAWGGDVAFLVTGGFTLVTAAIVFFSAPPRARRLTE